MPAPPPLDHSLYEHFVRHLLQHEGQCRAFLRTQLGSWDEVDDVMQETSLVAWRKYDQYAPGTSFLNWLLTIARFEALNHRRHRARSRLVLSAEVLDLIADEGIAEAEALESERGALDHCLEQLPPAQRELLRIAYQPGVRFADVAMETGRSAQALYKTIQRLRAALLLCVENHLREITP
ncbi:MAG: polymerase, sigma-24 subunit, subfamily [Verrucomicrobiaceae bacterium]|nr:polymerase, sigma-24 subunit, subfamily [Verrucomicrobiaceae bacterium]